MNSHQPSRRRAAYATLIGGYISIGVVVVQGVLLVPLYLQYIGPSLYGAWLGSGDIVGWLTILDMGLASLMIQRIGSAHGNRKDELVSQYLVAGLLAQMLMVVLLVAGTVLVSMWIPGTMGLAGTEARILSGSMILAGVASGLNILNNGVAGFAVALQRTVIMSIATLVGAVFGIGVSVAMLLNGRGLWAIPTGWIARESSSLICNGVYAILLYRNEIRYPLRTSRHVVRDFVTMSPALFAGKLGGAVAGRSEAALIAIFIRPELATVYVLTKRAADISRLLLDRFGGATFGSFSHLIGSGQQKRAAEVYREIMGIYFPVAVLAISLYMTLNHSFMSVWVGPEFFGGQFLTTLIGVSVISSAGSNLVNYLYGATGQIVRSSKILLIEGILRFGLMALFLYWFDLPGLPLAVILTTTVSALIVWRWNRFELSVPSEMRLVPQRNYILVGLLGLGAFLGVYVWAETWLGLLVVGSVMALLFLAMVMLVSEQIRVFAQSILMRIRSATR